MSNPEHTYRRKCVVDPAQTPDPFPRLIGEAHGPDYKVTTHLKQLSDVLIKMREQTLPSLLLSDSDQQPTNTVTTSVGVPRLPTNIVVPIIFRRAGWFTTFSASVVVNPAPLKAERAWKDATSGGRPVAISAPAAMRVNAIDSTATTKNVAIAYISRCFHVQAPSRCFTDHETGQCGALPWWSLDSFLPNTLISSSSEIGTPLEAVESLSSIARL